MQFCLRQKQVKLLFVHPLGSGARMKIAIVGSGISGLAAAHRLNAEANITLFEAGDYFGGDSPV